MDTSLRWYKPSDFHSVPANIVFREPHQTASQGITAIDIAIRIGEELTDHGWCILSLRKEHLGCFYLERIRYSDRSA